MTVVPPLSRVRCRIRVRSTRYASTSGTRVVRHAPVRLEHRGVEPDLPRNAVARGHPPGRFPGRRSLRSATFPVHPRPPRPVPSSPASFRRPSSWAAIFFRSHGPRRFASMPRTRASTFSSRNGRRTTSDPSLRLRDVLPRIAQEQDRDRFRVRVGPQDPDEAVGGQHGSDRPSTGRPASGPSSRRAPSRRPAPRSLPSRRPAGSAPGSAGDRSAGPRSGPVRAELHSTSFRISLAHTTSRSITKKCTTRTPATRTATAPAAACSRPQLPPRDVRRTSRSPGPPSAPGTRCPRPASRRRAPCRRCFL